MVRCSRPSKPRTWLIFGGTLGIVGLLMFVIAIVAKTAVYKSLTKAIYSMRYIDGAKNKEGCDVMILGDAACGSKQFEAWSMSSKRKYDTCMAGESPESKSLSMASRWCPAGESGCNKPDSCTPGEKQVFHLFSVLNPVGVLRGEKAEMQELEPIKMTKQVDKVEIDKGDLETKGVLEWKEAYRWTLTDPRDEALLDQVVVMPNPAMFSVVSDPSGDRVSTHAISHIIAAASFYAKFQEIITNMTRTTSIRTWFTGASAINFDSLVRDQFRAGTFTLALGEILASPACPLFVPLLSSAMKSRIPVEVSVAVMCHSGYRNNIGLSAFSHLLKASKLHVHPWDSPFFYEHEKGCPTKSDRTTYACNLDQLCPPDMPERAACMQPSLSEDEAEALFMMFTEIDSLVFSDKKDDADTYKLITMVKNFLTKSCLANATQVGASPEICASLIEQLVKVGKTALTVNHPLWDKKVKAGFGWSTNPLDSEIASKVIPYFYKGTVRDLMGYGLEKPKKDPMGGRFGPQLWVNSIKEDGSYSAFTKGPFVQQVSSKHGHEGLNYFVSVNGLKASCAFDFGCMTQKGFSGRHCHHVAGQCEPDSATGYGNGYIPGRIFGDEEYGTNRFHINGAKKWMFMPEFFIKGEFTQTQTSAVWREGLEVDKWTLSDINIKNKVCDSNGREMDCESPKDTKNLGYHLSYDVTMQDPRTLYVPMFASFPWFSEVVQSRHHGAYDPLSKLKITPCRSCPNNRDFSTQVWTEPETGAHVFGTQKLQVNMRLSTSVAAQSRIPGTTGATIDTAKVILGQDIDILLPMFWVERYDTASPYHAAKLAALQSLPRTINIIFGVLLSFGLLFIAGAALLIRKGLLLRKSQRKPLFDGEDSVKPGSYARPGFDTGRASTVEELTETSNSSCGPQALTSV